jgi:hypothetical protein
VSSIFGAATWPLGIAAGTAVGGAVAGAITPGVQELINEANAVYPLKPPSYFMLAEGVAKGRVDPQWAKERSAEQGISNDAFDRLAHIAQIGPGIDVAFELWRRKLISDGDFRRAVGEEAIDDAWLEPLQGLKEQLLSPAELANARQQEFIDDARLHSEGELQGYDAERMDLLYKMAGLPPGVMEGLEMLRRGIIDDATFTEIVAEGHTKTKYTEDLRQLRRRILSGYEAAGLRLRGWITQQESYALGALDGWEPAEMDQLWLNRGRPAAPGQMFTAAARGIDGPDGRPMDYKQFLKGVQESDIRTEWAPMLWDTRYLYPSLFQLTRLVTSGAIDPAMGADWAHKARYAPEVVSALEASWKGQTGGTTAKWAGRAQSRLFVVAHNEYVSLGITEDQARSALTEVGVGASEQDEVIRLWNAEIAIRRLELTPAEIRREYRKNVITQDEALSELQDKGMTSVDATKYLSSGPPLAPTP